MAQTIGEHGLYCPDPQDYAAYALYMQDLGTRIDEALQAQVDELDLFFNPPTIILTNSAPVIMAAGGASAATFDTVLFNNSSFMSYSVSGSVGTLSIGSAAGAPVLVPYLRGAYTIGMFGRMSATGAVTVGSERIAHLQVFDASGAMDSPLLIIEDITLDMNTGGNEAVLVKDNMLLTGESGVEVNFSFQNANIASTVSINAGAMLYVTYQGATDIIEVA